MNEEAIEFIGLSVVRDFADFIFTLSQDNLSDMGIDDRGFLRGSGDVLTKSNHIILQYTAEYADAVNSGTKPHAVSEEGQIQIRAWVERKLSIPREKVDQVAQAITWKIRKLGQKPKPFYDSALETSKIKYHGKLDLR